MQQHNRKKLSFHRSIIVNCFQRHQRFARKLGERLAVKTSTAQEEQTPAGLARSNEK